MRSRRSDDFHPIGDDRIEIFGMFGTLDVDAWNKTRDGAPEKKNITDGEKEKGKRKRTPPEPKKTIEPNRHRNTYILT